VKTIDAELESLERFVDEKTDLIHPSMRSCPRWSSLTLSETASRAQKMPFLSSSCTAHMSDFGAELTLEIFWVFLELKGQGDYRRYAPH
jgi:hypothetical protein